MIPKVDGDATPLGGGPHVFYLWFIECGLRYGWSTWKPDSVCSVGSGRSSVEAWCTTADVVEEVLSGVVEGDFSVFVADVVQVV